jgi:hypothetical protein
MAQARVKFLWWCFTGKTKAPGRATAEGLLKQLILATWIQLFFIVVVVVQYFNCQVSSVIQFRTYPPRCLTLNCCNRTTSGVSL